MTGDRSNELLAALAFEHAPVALSLLDLSHRQLHANAAYCELLRVSREHLESVTAESITHPDDLDRTVDYLDRLTSGDVDEVVTEKRYVRPDGTSFTARLTATPMRAADGTIVALLGVISDLTDQALFDRAQREIATREAVAGVAAETAHELNNVLASMLLRVDLVTDSAQRELIADLHVLLERATLLGEQLLALTDDTAPRRAADDSDGQALDLLPTVLVVDDEPSLLSSVATALRRSGYEVFEAADGEAALAVAQQHPIGVLVTDIVMPGIDGVALAATMRAAQPTLAVLFITGFAGGEPARRLPADATVLRKPFRALDLVSSVERLAGVAS